MSSYFDALAREVAEAHATADTPEACLEAVQAIEARLYQDVTQVTGDREFPDDLRERMLGVLAVKAVYQPGALPVPEKARRWVVECGSSRAVEDLHDLFHELARRRLVTRFGLLGDHPPSILARREEFDTEG